MPASQTAYLEQGEEARNLQEAQGRHISVTAFLRTVPSTEQHIIFGAPKDTLDALQSSPFLGYPKVRRAIIVSHE